MKRIDIQWDTVGYSSGIAKDISGIVTIWEGKAVLGMEATHSFRVTKSDHSTRLSQIDGNPLPNMTELENYIMRTMINSFYSGLTRDGHCSHWLERD